MLRELVGTEIFWQGIRAYYAEYQDANATTDDFRRFMEEASGQDLEWFFRQWLYRGGNPHLEASWSPTADGIRLQVRQVQDGPRFRIPLDVAVELSDGSVERHTVWLSEDADFDGVIALEGDIVDVTLDPDTRLLARWRMERRGVGPAPAP